MAKYQIADLREKRSALLTEAHKVLDAKQDTTDEARSAELETEYQRHESDLKELTTEIERRERLEGYKAEGYKAEGQVKEELRREDVVGKDEKRGKDAQAKLRDDEYREAMDIYLRRGKDELTQEQRSALTAGVDADGGYAVAKEWGDLVNGLRESSALRGAATVINGSTGGTLKIPRVANRMIIPGTGIVAEHVVTPDDAPDLNQVNLVTFTLRHMVKTSEEFVQDSSFDVEGFVGSELGFELGLKSGALYTNGTGTGTEVDTQPQGLFPALTAGTTAASIGYDQLVNLEHSVIAPYRVNGKWVMNDGTAAEIRKLKDGNGRPYWEYGLQVGQPSRIFGYEVLTEPYAPANGAAGTRPIAFGDIKRGLLIRDALGIGIRRLDERFADQFEVAWRGVLRTGSVLRDPNAVKALVKS